MQLCKITAFSKSGNCRIQFVNIIFLVICLWTPTQVWIFPPYESVEEEGLFKKKKSCPTRVHFWTSFLPFHWIFCFVWQNVKTFCDPDQWGANLVAGSVCIVYGEFSEWSRFVEKNRVAEFLILCRICQSSCQWCQFVLLRGQGGCSFFVWTSIAVRSIDYQNFKNFWGTPSVLDISKSVVSIWVQVHMGASICSPFRSSEGRSFSMQTLNVLVIHRLLKSQSFLTTASSSR